MSIASFVCLCRLQDEMCQREEAEGTMQNFRQVQYDSCDEIKRFYGMTSSNLSCNV